MNTYLWKWRSTRGAWVGVAVFERDREKPGVRCSCYVQPIGVNHALCTRTHYANWRLPHIKVNTDPQWCYPPSLNELTGIQLLILHRNGGMLSFTPIGARYLSMSNPSAIKISNTTLVTVCYLSEIPSKIGSVTAPDGKIPVGSL